MSYVITPNILNEDRHDRTRRVGWIDLDKVMGSRILVVGAGALGNEVLKNLLLAGVRHITVVDMDKVVRSNLNRCLFFDEKDALLGKPKALVLAEKAGQLDSEARVKGIVSRIEEIPERLFQEIDLVLGCLDNIAARLHVNAFCYHYSRPLVDGGTLGTSGKVQVALPPSDPCLQCSMNRSHYRVLERRYSCTGADTNYFEPKLAAEITTTSIIAAIQVREALKIISGKADSCLRHMFLYNGLTNACIEVEVELDPQCQLHN
ncbi:MAG: ThiF family adenylyltransferase [Methanomassiliicoccales archaeon]